MTGIRKAAVVLLSLDKALAAEVMSQLRKEEVEALTMEIARLDDVTKEEQDGAIEEFYDLGLRRLWHERTRRSEGSTVMVVRPGSRSKLAQISNAGPDPRPS